MLTRLPDSLPFPKRQFMQQDTAKEQDGRHTVIEILAKAAVRYFIRAVGEESQETSPESTQTGLSSSQNDRSL